MDPDWLTMNESAEVARCSTVTLAREIRAGRLKAYKLAGRRVWRLRKVDIDRWLSGGNAVEPELYVAARHADERPKAMADATTADKRSARVGNAPRA